MSQNRSPAAAPNPRVSLTAYATASAWAHFGFRHADRFNTRRGRALFLPLHHGCEVARLLSPAAGVMTRMLFWRHVWFTSWAARQQPGLALEVGAGLSARGVGFAEMASGTQWIDYDLPALVAAKRRMLEGHRLPPNYHLEAGNLLDPALGDDLQAPVKGPVIALTEGVVDYFDRDEKQRAWTTIASRLKALGGGRYLVDIHPRDRLSRFGRPGSVLLGALRRITGRDLNSQLCADSDDAIARLIDAGFEGARVLPEIDRRNAADAPAPKLRAFELIEAWV